MREIGKGRSRLSRLSLPTRVLLLVLGWLLVVGGVAGLFLPILQGGLMIFAGLVLVSLASTRVHRFVRARFHGRPRAWRRFEKLRRRLHRRLGGGA